MQLDSLVFRSIFFDQVVPTYKDTFWSGFVREMGKQWPCTFQDREGPIISTAFVPSVGIHWLLSDPEIKGS